MDADAFLTDLERKPATLRTLADRVADGLLDPVPLDGVGRVVFTGMGSSRFAALPVAAWLRARGIDAVVELASLRQGHPGGPGTLVVGVSATGRTPETVAALRQRAGGSRRLAITNDPSAALADAADVVVDLGAGAEEGGVACRTFQHTLAVLLALAGRLAGDPIGAPALCRQAAAATEDLLARRDRWLAPVTELLSEGAATHLLAPAERRSSAEQGALMVREGPRRLADACETGDWLHVDVYLTRPLDYRCVLFAGSRFDADVLGWLERRQGRCVAVGGEVPGADLTVRYQHDEHELVALLTEVLVAELTAWSWWHASEGEGTGQPAP